MLQLRLLGRLEVVDGGGLPVDIGGRQARVVLAALLLADGRAVSTDALIDILWGDDAPTSAAGTLQSYVSRLRRQLGSSVTLRYDGSGYRLDVDDGVVDHVEFERLADEGRRLLDAGDAAAASRLLTQAERLWRGAALAEFADLDFARAAATRLEQRRLTATEDRFDADLRLGRHAAVVDELAATAAANPLRERLTMQLATALYRSGRQAEALRSIAQAGQVLREELGIEPSKPLRDLESAILAHDPSLDLPAMPSPAAAAPALVAVAPEQSTFVGRDPELADVLATLDEAVHQGRFVVVEGEPGIGKTRLADEFAAAAAASGALTVWGRADEGGAAPALWPWLDPLRALSDLVGDAPESVIELLSGDAQKPSALGDAARFERFEAIRGLLASAAARLPIVVLLDDLHWADDTTLDLLTFLASRLPPGIVVVCTMRVLDIGRNDAVTQALAAIARRPGSRRIQLRGLPLTDTARMLAAKGIVSPSVVSSIHGRAEGNPFFTMELSRLVREEGTIVGDVPGSVGDVIRRRLARLPQPTVDLLGVAAVVGRQFDLGLLARASGMDMAEVFERLEPAVVVRLVSEQREHPGQLRFDHALVREVLLEDLTSLRRARLHLQVADAIEAGAPSVDDVEILAEHLWRASPIGVGARAAAALERAADVALQRVAFASAEDQLTRAVQLRRATGVTTDDHEAELHAIRRLLEVARARRYYQGVDNPTVLARSRELARLLGRPNEIIDIIWVEWAALATACRRAEAEIPAMEFARLTAADPRPHVRAMGLQVLGVRAWEAGEIGESVRLLEAALPMYTETGEELAGFYAESFLVGQSFAAFMRAAHDTTDVDAAMTTYVELIERLNDPFATVTLCGFACTTAMTHGAWHHLQHFTDIIGKVDPDLQYGFWSDQNLMATGVYLALSGRVDEAVTTFALGVSRYTGIGGRSGLATFHAALAEVLATRPEHLSLAAQYAAEARAWLERDDERWNHTSVCIAEAVVAAAEGRLEEAAGTLVTAVEVAEQQEAFALARRARAVAAELGLHV